jgi:hypothetical protein
MNYRWIVFLACASILLSGCAPGPLTADVLDPNRATITAPGPTATPGPTRVSPSPTPRPTRGDLTLEPLPTGSISAETIEMTPPSTPDPAPDFGSNPLVDKARANLAARLSIDPQQIALVEFRSVVWPDGSFGCPQPGIGYIQMQVEGYFIQLSVNKRVFNYHGGQRQEPFLCESSDEMLPPPGLDK